MRLNAAVVPVTALIILFPLGYTLVRSVLSRGEEPGRPFLEQPVGKQVQCVRETTYMRFHHMDLLKQLRNDAVRKGEREEITLNTCRECHPSRERFCNRCHDAVNLHPDCFRCHYYP
jgi:hypothetical protein